MQRTYSHIDLDERRKIARWRMTNISVETIAEKLGRHRSTIFRELKRNQFNDDEIKDLTGYYCTVADQKARERRWRQRKLIRFAHLRQSVVDRISHGWSPQQIAGRMRLERPPFLSAMKRSISLSILPRVGKMGFGSICPSAVPNDGHDMQDDVMDAVFRRN